MKPFNLERALAGDPVVTRAGEPVTQLTVFDADEMDYIYGVVNREVLSWNDSGQYYFGQENDYDLFMKE